MRRLMILLLVFTAACSPTGSSTASETPLSYTGLDLKALGAHRAVFELAFYGDWDWTYQMVTLTDGHLVEYRLHLEGVSADQNPGDVRMVIDGETSRMRGQGTEEQCLQFPTALDLGLSFLTPDDLIDPGGFEEPLVWVEEAPIAGVDATHYSMQQQALDAWQSVMVDLWLDQASGATLRYDLRANGPDPLFDAGEGELVGQFVVREVGPQTIEPVEGCEIDLPLPPDAALVSRLSGGLVIFESGSTVQEMAAFYQAELPAAGWESLAEPQIGDDAIELFYHKGEQTLDISIEMEGANVRVALWPGEE